MVINQLPGTRAATQDPSGNKAKVVHKFNNPDQKVAKCLVSNQFETEYVRFYRTSSSAN